MEHGALMPSSDAQPFHDSEDGENDDDAVEYGGNAYYARESLRYDQTAPQNLYASSLTRRNSLLGLSLTCRAL